MPIEQALASAIAATTETDHERNDAEGEVP
jgi:hypothetical protein